MPTTQKKTTLYLDAAKIKELKMLAVKEETTMTALIEQAIDEYLARRGQTALGPPN